MKTGEDMPARMGEVAETVRPAISVITICYRNPAELDETLSSCATLNPALIEVVIVDGSPDASCSAVAARYPTFRHLHGPDRGKYDAMNKGIEASRGDALLFMNSGDKLADPATLADIVCRHRVILASTMIYGDCIRLINGEQFTVRAPVLTDANIRLGFLPSHQSILIPASYHRIHRYDDELHFAADTKFLKVAFRALPQLHVQAPIGVFAYGGISTSPGSWRLLARQYRELREVHELRIGERVRVAVSLVRRKLIRELCGEAGLQRLQGWRLRRSLAQRN